MGLYHRGGERQKAFHNFLPSLLADAPFHSALYKPPQNNMEHDRLTCQQALFIFCNQQTFLLRIVFSQQKVFSYLQYGTVSIAQNMYKSDGPFLEPET